MLFSLKRINAIFIKDFKDTLRNSYVIFTVAIPLVFAAFISRIGEESEVFMTYPINLALVIAGAFIQAAMVAEEKEKNTLRGLLLSPASTTEIFIGKSALSALMTIIVIIGSIFLAEYQVASPILFTLSIVLALVFYIAVGTILGLISKTVMETSIVGMPVLLIFGMSSMFKSVLENESLLTIVNYLPNEQLNLIWFSLSDGAGFRAVSQNLFVLFIWMVAAVTLTIVIYKRRRVD